MPEPLVLRCGDRLGRHRPLEHAGEVRVGLRGPSGRRQRTETLGKRDRVRRQAECAAADGVAKACGRRIGDPHHVAIGGLQQLRARFRSERGGVAVRRRRGGVVIRRVSRLDQAVAHHALDAALAGARVPQLRVDRREREARAVVRRRVEVDVERTLLHAGRVDRHVLQRHVVHVVRRHVTPRTGAVDERSRTRNGLMAVAEVEARRASARVGERIVARLRGAVGRRGRLAIAARRDLARRQQKRRAPRRIAPRVRHHRSVPLVEDARVAVAALARVIDPLPVLLERRRDVRRFRRHVRRRFRDAVRELDVRRRRRIDERERRQHRGGGNRDDGGKTERRRASNVRHGVHST